MRLLGDKAYGVTHFAAVPTMYQMLASVPEFDRAPTTRTSATRSAPARSRRPPSSSAGPRRGAHSNRSSAAPRPGRPCCTSMPVTGSVHRRDRRQADPPHRGPVGRPAHRARCGRRRGRRAVGQRPEHHARATGIGTATSSSPTGSFAPATRSDETRTATTRTPAGSRTCTSRAARTCTPPRSRRFSRPSRASSRSRSSAYPTMCGAKSAWRSSWLPMACRSTSRRSSELATAASPDTRCPKRLELVESLPRNVTGKVAKAELRSDVRESDPPEVQHEFRLDSRRRLRPPLRGVRGQLAVDAPRDARDLPGRPHRRPWWVLLGDTSRRHRRGAARGQDVRVRA